MEYNIIKKLRTCVMNGVGKEHQSKEKFIKYSNLPVNTVIPALMVAPKSTPLHKTT